jgi:hypothetical protein
MNIPVYFISRHWKFMPLCRIRKQKKVVKRLFHISGLHYKTNKFLNFKNVYNTNTVKVLKLWKM